MEFYVHFYLWEHFIEILIISLSKWPLSHQIYKFGEVNCVGAVGVDLSMIKDI